MSAELKPCPFCGSKEIDPRGWASTDSAGPACDDCGAATGDVGDTLEENIRLWNTRVSQWLPIESAPRTTRSILVWCPERQNQYMVSWDDRYEEGEWRTVGGWTALTEQPTHWQPLPAAPEVE